MIDAVSKVVRTSRRILHKIGREPTPEELAEKLGMPLERVRTPALAENVPQTKSHKFYLTAHAIVIVSVSDRRVADAIKLGDARK